MHNVEMKVTGQTLTLTVDLSKPGSMSRTGKSMVVASTEGNVTVPGKPDFKIGLNLYTPRA